MCWSGPEATVYFGLDTADDLAFMEGNTRVNLASLVPGKVDSVYYYISLLNLLKFF